MPRTHIALAMRCVASAALVSILLAAAQAQTFSVIYNFAGAPGGQQPQGNLAIDRNGVLYGTTVGGGNTQGFCTVYSDEGGCGTVFRLKPVQGGWILSVLYKFTGGSDGALPDGGVVIGPDGALYGTTSQGGNDGCTYTVIRP